MIKENLKQLLREFGPGSLPSMNELKEELRKVNIFYCVKKEIKEVTSYNDVLVKHYDGGVTVLFFLEESNAADFIINKKLTNEYNVKQISFYDFCCKFYDEYNFINLELICKNELYVFMSEDVEDYIYFIENNYL